MAAPNENTENGHVSAIALAPGAGAGLGKLVFDSLLASPDVAKRIADQMLAGLEASTERWDKGRGEWVQVPDWRVRMQTVFGILAQAEGEPIKRIVHQHLNQTAGEVDIAAALRDSPALAAAMEKELEKARWRTSGQKAHKVPRKVDPEIVVE